MSYKNKARRMRRVIGIITWFTMATQAVISSSRGKVLSIQSWADGMHT